MSWCSADEFDERAGTQGLGYLAGFLLLVVEPDQVARMLHRIGSDSKYTPGYWKGQPECFVRDAMVCLSSAFLPFLPKEAQHWCMLSGPALISQIAQASTVERFCVGVALAYACVLPAVLPCARCALLPFSVPECCW